MKNILIIGDSYIKTSLFKEVFNNSSLEDNIEYATISQVKKTAWDTSKIREFEGDPREVSFLIADYHKILVIHGAPVTRDVLKENSNIKLIACARGGPVNIDIDAAKEFGVRVTTTPGKNSTAVADLTIGFIIQLIRNVTESFLQAHHSARTGQKIVESNFDGAKWFGRELLETKKVIITPHIAGETYETVKRGSKMLLSEIQLYLTEKKLQWEI